MLLGRTIHYPRHLEIRYRSALLMFVRFIKGRIRKKLLNNLADLLSDRQFIRKDDTVDDIEYILNNLEGEINAEVEIYLLRALVIARETANFSLRQVSESLLPILKVTTTSQPVNIFSSLVNRDINELVKSWSITNARLIKSISADLLEDVSILIQNAYRSGIKTSVVRDEIIKKFGSTESRAELIARDQIAKLNSNIVRHQYLEAGITDFKWLTSMDDRVRESHKVLNGKICTWSDATIYKNNISDINWKSRRSIGGVLKQPGEDYQCRCTLTAVIKK